MSASRKAALDVLDATLSGKATLDRAFDRAAGRYRLEGPDRAFARAMIAITLRRIGEIDAVLEPLLKRPLPRKALTATNILRLGVTQSLFLETPAHAAVGETTSLAMGRSQTYRGLVNAVLRRVAEAGPSVLEDKPSAARLNTPGWLWEGWRKAYGAETVADIAAVHMQEPPLDFTILKGDPVDWANRFGGFVLPTGGVRLARSAKATDLPGYSAGSWLPQDAAAAMPACLFGDLKDKQVIDLCAAPGGKTAQLAAKGAQVTAVDMGELRMERLAENMNRLGLTVKTVVADALEWRPEALVDAVLLDAPCSATGTIRRHPDVPWTKTTGAVRSLLPIQSELLDAAAEMVRPGGMLIYACCSLQPEEGPAQAAAFLKRRPDFVRAPITLDDLPGLPAEAITEQGDLRTLPSFWADRGGMDGFYGVRLVKQPQ